jgi:hypothetical protein
MKIWRALLLGLIVLLPLFCHSSMAQGPASAVQKTSTSELDSELQKVIEKFWTALGDLDQELVRQTFSFPVTIVETAPDQTKNPRVLMTPMDLERDFRGSKPASGKSEFYGTKFSQFKFQMVNDSLALVTYVCTLPKAPYHTDSNLFNAVTILRKDPTEREPWKIIFITVPR